MSNTPLAPAPVASEHIGLKARNVSFGWEGTPLHWLPGDPFATHTINVLHLLLPAGERWFVHVYKQVLPYIKDEQLRADVVGFIGQEAMHAAAHDDVLPTSSAWAWTRPRTRRRWTGSSRNCSVTGRCRRARPATGGSWNGSR